MYCISITHFSSFYSWIFHSPNLKFQPFRLYLLVNVVLGKDLPDSCHFISLMKKALLIMMLLKVGGNNWWTVITVLQSMINQKYFLEWHVYFSCWKNVSEKFCMTLTHHSLRRNNLPFFFLIKNLEFTVKWFKLKVFISAPKQANSGSGLTVEGMLLFSLQFTFLELFTCGCSLSIYKCHVYTLPFSNSMFSMFRIELCVLIIFVK